MHPRRSRIFACFVFVSLITMFSGLSAVGGTQGASFQGLGKLPGAATSVATAVSDDGRVVVGWSGDHAKVASAFRWTQDEGMSDLGALIEGSSTRAHAVNGDGSVIVGESGGVAFRWTSSHGMVSLGTLPGPSSSSARGVSADGLVVVGVSGNLAFRWTSESGMTSLGTLPGASTSTANAISADGQVIVGSSGSMGFRWTIDTGMIGIGPVNTPCWTYGTYATATNRDGTFIAGIYMASYWGCSKGCDGACMAFSTLNAFRWSSSQGNIVISACNLCGALSTNAMSQDGSVMVGTTTVWDSYPFIWHHAIGVVPSLSYIQQVGADLSGWDVDVGEANGVSADGRTLVGSGFHDGQIEAWIAVIPIPGQPAGDITGDGAVNASDLLAVINQWGPCHSPQVPCPADIAPAGGDFVVNCIDLLQVINDWQ